MRYTVLVVALLATGCAYHSPTEPTRSTQTSAPLVPTSIRLTGSTRADRRTDLTATVLAADYRLVSGVTVTFTASVGVLSATSAVTDTSGVAVVTLTAAQASTVTASTGNLTTEVAVAASPTPTIPTPQPTPTPTPPTPDPVVPLTVTLNVLVAQAGSATLFGLQTQAISRAVWTTGDGATFTTTVPTLTYAYANAGTYTAGVTVTDLLGRSASDTKTVIITAAPTPTTPTPSLTLTLGCVAAGATKATSCNLSAVDETGAIATSAITAAFWQWGDGGGDSRTGSTSVIAQHTYAQPGTFTVQVTADGPGGRRGRATVNVTIPSS